MNEQGTGEQNSASMSRRALLKSLSFAAAGAALSGCGPSAETLSRIFQRRFKELSQQELDELLARLSREYSAQFKKDVTVSATPPLPGTHFGYALDISRCIGCRRCVYGCVEENNQSRDPQVHWISVLQLEKDKGVDLVHSDQYYDAETVPQEDKFYLPVACQQCENPPCVKVCPVKATWKEKDGIVVIDQEWCVGCRCCMTACPYGARHFNWKKPEIPAEELNPNMEYLGNRPRNRGVVEKCTFCIQRVRHGRYPKCVEVCPVGARKFGNLLDPESEVRYILKNKRVFILKEELNTRPSFFYFYG